ncbi:MarR family winged helix-turn-helix transcriptional regulator [Flavobacterium litorale]|uniref:MarR family winged helix-turn-helix transcriptional regulator n=1 Tax=Flavobacterium litorale TaxID=2856519 RepID=A0ABX8V8P2_9FLAO|nr:MarR family winged helix-turn-helix transcriptional regulator [Flavobacterium litorale]QYJ67401.1 MarR family winged helix-turn-helix transcriptional regulator [Flavobacterium litorale]
MKETIYTHIASCNPTLCISGKINRCTRIIGNVFRKHLKDFNITSSQLSVLFVIMKNKEVNQKKVSDVLYLEKSTVNRNLNRLVKSSYVYTDEHLKLKITEKGYEFLEKVIPQWNKAMDEIREKIKPEGEEALNILLSTLTKQ